MAVPRNRHSNARKNTKRSHHAKTPKQFNGCSTCGALKPLHVLCQYCGTYKGKQVIERTEG